MTVDDVLDLTRIDQVALSPDGRVAAVVLQRPARRGEVYGRTAYEVDPARSDVWLVSTETGERRNLTEGASDAAGFWCATWSPDGTRLAMLSTRPEGGEPRGGDNVRLYLWDGGADALRRLSDRAIMTQTRYGSPLYSLDLRGGSAGPATHRCSDQENAPFLWLDDTRLLAAMLPPGEVSGLIDESSRPFRHAGQTAKALRDGAEPTLTAAGSGAARLPEDERIAHAELSIIAAASGAAADVATLPVYPFHGELTVDVAPDGARAAILASVGAIPPERGGRIASPYQSWLAEKRMGFVVLASNASVQWLAMPAEGRFPLELLGWSPDGRRAAFRARRAYATDVTPLFVASWADGSVRRIGPDNLWVDETVAGPVDSGDLAVFWTGQGRLLARLGDGERKGWWLLSTEGEHEPIGSEPAVLQRSLDGRFFGMAAGALVELDMARRTFVERSIPALSEGASLLWPRQGRFDASRFLVASEEAEGGQAWRLLSFDGSSFGALPLIVPRSATLVAFDPARNVAFWTEASRTGLHLRAGRLDDGSRRDLLPTNTHLAEIEWGETRLLDYRGSGDELRKAAVILPPGYREGRRYPVITWIYPGYQVRSRDTYFLDPYLPGIYNLQLYAARGFVVLIPSIPRLPAVPGALADYTQDILPAVDQLVDVGIGDAQRVGLMGQSSGGFAVYAMVTQTRRFRAAVALAGITDLTSNYTEFDGASRGYPGIDHEKSVNWDIIERVAPGLGVAPYEDPDLYTHASPLRYVHRVETPLLLIHGEHDKRGQLAQAESFFYGLYRQGKTARLLRYWGESHALAQSPANIRSIHQEIVDWFGTYLGQGDERATGDHRAPGSPDPARPSRNEPGSF